LNLNKKISNKITTDKIINFLIGMVLIGSIIGIENSQAFGCVIEFEMLSLSNLLFLMISLILFISIKKTQNLNTKIILCSIELAIWIGKYFFYKGGYISGFSGEPNIFNVVYDFSAISVRMLLLIKLVNIIENYLIPSLIVTVLIVVIKINFFALPWYTSYIWALEDKASIDQRVELIGDYYGEIVELESQSKSALKIQIDSTKMIFLNKSFRNLKDEYRFNIEYLNSGILGSNNEMNFQIRFEKIEEDSLIFYIEDMHEKKYLVKMKTKR
jgi:hypothetical protein